MGEEGSHLLVPDLPLSAAGRWNDDNAEEPKGKRLQMVKLGYMEVVILCMKLQFELIGVLFVQNEV